jgi:uncharacterized protein (TIGR02646 family)
MIYINRKNVPMPSLLDLSNETSVASIERRKCIQYYKDQHTDSFPFEAYGKTAVRSALETLFHDKCAYCESNISSTGDLQVEHYRPKNKVKLEEKWTENGYYWLAADWNNLFPSCVRCNQLRRYIDEHGKIITGGKGSYFPLIDETKRVLSPEVNIEQEEPLLIDPCVDNPAEHLCFLEDGSVVHRSDKGRRSIEIYALFRPGLNNLRSMLYKEIKFLFIEIDIVIGKLSGNNTTEFQDNINQIERYLLKLKEFTTENSLYSGFARQFIEEYIDQRIEILEKVLNTNSVS